MQNEIKLQREELIKKKEQLDNPFKFSYYGKLNMNGTMEDQRTYRNLYTKIPITFDSDCTVQIDAPANHVISVREYSGDNFTGYVDPRGTNTFYAKKGDEVSIE